MVNTERRKRMTGINILAFPFSKAKSWRYEHSAQLASRIWDGVELRTRGDRRIIRVKNTDGGYHNNITVGRLMSVVYDFEQDPHNVGRKGRFWRNFYTFLPGHAHLFLRRKGTVYNELADTMIANYGGKDRFQGLLDWIISNPNMPDKQFERGYFNWKHGGELPSLNDQGSLIDSRELMPKGVRFDQAAEFPESLGNIIGAVYDESKQRLILLGDGNPTLPAFRADDLAIALLCAWASIQRFR